MRKFTHSYIATPLFLLILIACHSKTDRVAARTPPFFHDSPVKSDGTALTYDTSSAASRNIIAQLDEFYRKQPGFNGSVLIGSKGKIIYERYFGYSNREKRIPLSPANACQLASVSKTFTATAILYLYERKYLNIDDPVQHYLKEFPYTGITLRMLLCHRSGIPDYTKWVPDYKEDFNTPISNEEVMQMMAKYKPALEFKPNSRFKYCNTNYAILARVIEEVTEMDFRKFMNTYIFEPLGMTHTFIANPAKGLPDSATISYKYNWVREPNMFADGVYGDKNVYSTVEDMYRWDQSFYQNKLISNEITELAYGPCSFEKPGVKNYGLGWRMLCYPDGNKIIYHNGWWHGNNTSFYRFIKDDLTIIVLGNRFTNSIYHQAPAIYGIVKGVTVVNGFDNEE